MKPSAKLAQRLLWGREAWIGGRRVGAHGRRLQRTHHRYRHGAVVIAAITSCTNTSNPSVMLGAVAGQKAVEAGLVVPPYVKPVWPRFARGGRLPDTPDFYPIWSGWGSTSSALAAPPASAIPGRCRKESPGHQRGNLVVVLRAQRQPQLRGPRPSRTRSNYLASPPLVVAYALASSTDRDMYNRTLGHRARRPTCLSQ